MEESLFDIEKRIVKIQQQICVKYYASYLPSPFDGFVGVALESFKNMAIPFNGLRHSLKQGESVSWYIWAGGFSEDDDFFKPLHVWHLLEMYPKAINYLGLASGWRFLFDDNYEDVWFDKNLLKI